MIHAIQIPAEHSTGDNSSPARQIAAVAHCCNAWQSTFQASYSRDKNEYAARKAADKAYHNAIPLLYGYQNICDFIACVTHGMVIDAIKGATGSKLLYAAQIALKTLSSQPNPPQTAQE